MLSRRVVRMGRRDAAERRFRTALVAALLLHALVAGFAHRAGGRREATAPGPVNVEIDLVLPPPEAPKKAASENAHQAADEASAEEQRVERPVDRPAARADRETPGGHEGARASELPEVLTAEGSEPNLDSIPSGRAKERATEERPRLSLDALGIGSQNPFLDAGPPSDGKRPKVTAEEVQARLEHSLTNDIARADQARGLGPEGPLLASLEGEARRSAAPPKSSALFRLSTDGNGTLVGVQVLEASSDPSLWKELGERVLVEYAQKKLRGKHGARGLTFEIRVTSRVTLPSGSERPVGVTLPSSKDAFPALKGDLADIGGRPARRVNARLERIWAN